MLSLVCELSDDPISPDSASPTPGSQASCPTCWPAQLYIWQRLPSPAHACVAGTCCVSPGAGHRAWPLQPRVRLLWPALRHPYKDVHATQRAPCPGKQLDVPFNIAKQARIRVCRAYFCFHERNRADELQRVAAGSRAGHPRSRRGEQERVSGCRELWETSAGSAAAGTVVCPVTLEPWSSFFVLTQDGHLHSSLGAGRTADPAGLLACADRHVRAGASAEPRAFIFHFIFCRPFRLQGFP